MRLVPVSCAAIVAMAAGQVASAQFIEGFEHGDWAGNYTALQGSGAETLSAAAARSGSFGATLTTGAWWKNSNPGAVINDGESFSYWFRGTGGRAYIGFTSDDFATQAYTVVAAPNTGNLLIQRNNGFGFSDIATSSPITWSGTEFYEIVATYENGVITAEVFNSSGVSQAPPIMADTGHLTGGTMFIRGFSSVHIDDLEFGGGASENALVLDWNSINGIGAAATAAAGLNPLVTTTPGDFVAQLGAAPWRMVTIDNPSNGFDGATSDAIASYVAKGGRTHMSYWNLDADPTLQAAFGVASATDFFAPRSVFARDAHASWGGLGSVAAGSDAWNDNGDTLTVASDCGAGAPIIVGDFDSAGSGEGAIVTTGQTLVNGFDYDSMDLAAVERLVTNQIRWLRSSDPTPARGPTGCIADCDKNGEVDFFDFLCFQNLFAAGDCQADCDRNGDLDFFDFLCFQNEFAAGCPDLELKEYGTEAPPSVDCGTPITQFPLDPRPVFTDVVTVDSPLGGQVEFDIFCNVRQIGFGWATWSHGYTGSVYYTNGSAVLNITPPANSAFYVYVEPNPFADIEFEITGSAAGFEVSATDFINGSAGAKGYGFCGGVENVRVRTTDGFTDFAVGEFGIAD